MKRIALITGASRGIGAATARALAADGCTVVVNYHQSREAAETLAASLGGMAYGADVADADAVKGMVAEILRAYGRIDVLVNNAAVSVTGLFQSIAPADAARLYAVNLFGVCNVTRAVLPAMLTQKQGVIVNIASLWGETGGSCEVDYSATKGAVIALTKALAKEVGPSGIRVNCVSPGVIATDMNAHLTAEDLAALQAETPLTRLGTPEDAAEAIRFLCSDRAGFITGQVLGVNGGILI